MLTALVLVGIICAMLMPNAVFTGNFTGTKAYSDIHSVTMADEDYYTSYTESHAVKIDLRGDYAETDSKNVVTDGAGVTIVGGGVYLLSGTLYDGSIIIDSQDGAAVRLFFDGVDITSSDFSALYIKQSEKTVISLIPETENILTDGAVYSEEKLTDAKPSAALYSKDDLVINGSGSLTVNGNYKDGIKANDTLKITEAKFTVNAADNGIKVNDCIAVIDSDISVTSSGDSIKCDHEEEKNGFIAIENSALALLSGGDGISASSAVYINDSSATVTAGGGSENAEKRRNGMPGRFGFDNRSDSENETSTKAIKAGTDVEINGGSFVLNSKDDAIHSNRDVNVESGVFEIASGDDALHADRTLTVCPDSMNISKCYEGLEGAYVIINGGDIKIISDDDGINATGENDTGRMYMPGDAGDEKTSEEDIWLTVNGGHVYIETSGDGFDSNGSALINGGFLEIYGPQDGGNGSIDVGDGGYVLIMNGGSLLAAGSADMAEHPTDVSAQRSTAFYLDEEYSAGSKITLKDSNGNEIISGTSAKSFEWVCISAESLTENEEYTLYINEKAVSSVVLSGVYTQSGNKNRGMNSPEKRK